MLTNNQKRVIKEMFKRADTLKHINIMIDNLYRDHGNSEKIKYMMRRKSVIAASIVLLGWDYNINSGILRRLNKYSQYK